MAITQLMIIRDSEEAFRFEAYKPEPVMELHQERCDIIRFMDDAIDTLMRLKNLMTSKEITYMHHHSFRVNINAGDQYEPL